MLTPLHHNNGLPNELRVSERKWLIPIRNHGFAVFPSGIPTGKARCGINNHTVILLRRIKAHIPFPDVFFHPFQVTLQGIAVSAGNLQFTTLPSGVFILVGVVQPSLLGISRSNMLFMAMNT
jgi:hypothetical protein